MRIRPPRFIDNLSIQKKFIVLYLVCALIPLIVVQAYVLIYTTSEIRARERQNAEMSLDRAFSTIDSQLSGAVALSNAIATDKQMLGWLFDEYAGPIPYYAEYYDAIRPKINRYLSAYVHQVTGIELYVDNPTILSGGHLMRMDEGIDGAPWYAGERSTLHAVAYMLRGTSGSPRPQISVVRPVEGKRSALLKVDMSMEPIHRAIYQERTYLDLYLISPSGHVVSYAGSLMDYAVSDWSMQPPAAPDMTVSFSEGSFFAGWRLMAITNTEALSRSILDTALFSLGLAAALGVIAALVVLVIARSFLRRSKILLTHMDAVAEGSFARIEGDMGEDELGELVDHYNDMSAQLGQLIDDVYVLELQKKSLDLERLRAEMKYLQAQIDPHFLFNTLNAILVVCMKYHYDEVTPVIRSLSKILRRMADASEDLSPLSTEMDFVRMYLDIMQFRYGEKLSYALAIAPECMEVLLPKLSVQALVENACKHSLEHIIMPGLITVEATLEEGMMRLCVSDNGLGMPPERLEALRAGLRGEGATGDGIGLVNVTRRLALHYGGEASFDIDSVRGEGTTVTMRLPARRKGGEALAHRDTGG